MIHHVALAGQLEGTLGLGVDIVGTAVRIASTRKSLARWNERTLAQRVVSFDGRPIRSAHGRSIAVDGKLDLRSIRSGDVLAIPGIVAADETEIAEVLARPDVRQVVAILPRAVAKGARIAASCSASFLVAAAGLLDGGSATTTWWLMPCFAQRHPTVRVAADRMLVDHDAVLTAGSAFAHADLMLAVLARLASPSLAHLVAKYLVLDPRVSQSRYMVMDHLRSFDPTLRALERYVGAHLDQQLPLGVLAKAASTSPRTLARRIERATGMTPLAFVRQVRMAHAAHLLETTQASVDEVAERVGYADAAAFRRAFRRATGEAPKRRRADADPPATQPRQGGSSRSSRRFRV